IYFTPERSDPLTVTAAAWLGRNAFGGEAGRLPAATGLTPAELSFHTASARRYGFHATLKAPFRLIQGQTVGSLERALAVFAQSAAPIAVPRLAVQRIDGCFALVPDEPLAAAATGRRRALVARSRRCAARSSRSRWSLTGWPCLWHPSRERPSRSTPT